MIPLGDADMNMLEDVERFHDDLEESECNFFHFSMLSLCVWCFTIVSVGSFFSELCLGCAE